jgi:hypothetical protein
MKIIAHAGTPGINNEDTLSVNECGSCGLMHYTAWGERWTCPVCYPPGTSSFTIGKGARFIYRPLAILRRMRGTVVFKAFNFDCLGQTHTSLSCHHTGPRDPGRAPNKYGQRALFRRIRDVGIGHRGGCPRRLAQHLNTIRSK